MITRRKSTWMTAHLLMLCLLAAPPVRAEDEVALPSISSRPVRMALFKNGLGYMEREAVIPAGVESGVLDAMPSPVHGTFWVTPETEGVTLRRIVAGWSRPEGSVVVRDVRNITELLEANDGEELELLIVTPGGAAERIRGRIRLLGSATTMPEEPERYASGFLPPVGMGLAREAPHLDHATAARLSRSPMVSNRDMWMYHDSMHASAATNRSHHATTSPRLVLIETGEGQLVMDSSSVRHVSGADLRVQVEEPGILRPRVTIDVAGNEAGARLNLAYMAQGITWAPGYRVELLDDKTLRLRAKALIINDLEDLRDVRCSFIAGFPNVPFSHVTDPLAFRGDMPSWLRSLSRDPHHGRNQHVMTQQVRLQTLSNTFIPEDVDMETGFDPAAFAARGGGDLFHYEIENVTLKRGERGHFPLFTAEVPYESVYTCHIRESQNTVGGHGETEPEDVWHALRIGNTSQQPWTTAPATVTKDGSFLGQGTMYFTSLGSRTLLRFAKALDVRVTAAERETARERNVRHLDNRAWDLVTAEGTVRVSNLKPVPVTILVHRTVTGEVVANPDDAEQTLSASGITAINPTSNLTWEVTVQPREAKTLTYTYNRYVR